MSTNGEKINWQGQIFSESCEKLVKELNYQEKKTRSSGNDMIASPQEDLGGLLKPFFSPQGLTLFEFTTKGDTGQDEIDNFVKKIKSGLDGCVLVRNIKINDKLLEYAKNKKIFCWDIRTINFLSAKILLYKIWSKYGKSIEKNVSNDITYIRCLEKNTVNKVFQIRVVLLSQNPLKELGSDDITKAINFIKSDIITSGISTCQVKIIILTRSLPRKDLFNQLDSILKKASSDDIAFTTVKKPIVEFYTSPFLFELCLSENPEILL